MQTYQFVLKRHFQKPKDVRERYENAFYSLSRDQQKLERFLDRQGRFFYQADEHENDVLEWEEYTDFVNK